MPASYQPPTAGDARQKTTSQTVESNIAAHEMRIADLLEGKSREVFSIAADDTIGAAVAVLREQRIGALVVLDEGGSLTGILSERDIVRKLAETPGQTLPQSVAENMTRKVMTCDPRDTLVEVLRRMTEGRFRHMPVMESGKVTGMVTIGDVVHFRLTQLEHEALQLKQLIVG